LRSVNRSEAQRRPSSGHRCTRDWEQYHAPKNLAMALSVEAAEIVEIFQWKKGDEPLSLAEQEHLRQEIGDVLVYLLELADKFEIDIIEAAKCY